MARLTIDDSNWAERARLRCPAGHSWWDASRASWYCRTCGRSYEALVDAKTGRRVTPDEVRFRGRDRPARPTRRPSGGSA